MVVTVERGRDEGRKMMVAMEVLRNKEGVVMVSVQEEEDGREEEDFTG